MVACLLLDTTWRVDLLHRRSVRNLFVAVIVLIIVLIELGGYDKLDLHCHCHRDQKIVDNRKVTEEYELIPLRPNTHLTRHSWVRLKWWMLARACYSHRTIYKTDDDPNRATTPEWIHMELLTLPCWSCSTHSRYMYYRKEPKASFERDEMWEWFVRFKNVSEYSIHKKSTSLLSLAAATQIWNHEFTRQDVNEDDFVSIHFTVMEAKRIDELPPFQGPPAKSASTGTISKTTTTISTTVLSGHVSAEGKVVVVEDESDVVVDEFMSNSSNVDKPVKLRADNVYKKRWVERYWANIHLACWNYPPEPRSDAYNKTFTKLIRTYVAYMPCGWCIDYGIPAFDASPIPFHLGRIGVWHWSICYHNDIRLHLELPPVSHNDATRYWNEFFCGYCLLVVQEISSSSSSGSSSSYHSNSAATVATTATSANTNDSRHVSQHNANRGGSRITSGRSGDNLAIGFISVGIALAAAGAVSLISSPSPSSAASTTTRKKTHQNTKKDDERKT